MTDRERLIELIGERTPIFTESAENLADHLLANMVKVVPCRCKDCAYLRESDKKNRAFCTYHGDDYEFETFPNHYCSNGVGMVKGA